jgi:hypothetical protein
MIFFTLQCSHVERFVYIRSTIGKVYEFFTLQCNHIQRGVYIGSSIGKVYEFFLLLNIAIYREASM